MILNGFKFLQGDINSDTLFMFSFQFIQDPATLEGAPSHLSSLVVKCFHSSFVDPSTLVDQRTGRDRPAQIYVSNDDNVDMSLFLFPFGLGLVVVCMTPVL